MHRDREEHGTIPLHLLAFLSGLWIIRFLFRMNNRTEPAGPGGGLSTSKFHYRKALDTGMKDRCSLEQLKTCGFVHVLARVRARISIREAQIPHVEI